MRVVQKFGGTSLAGAPWSTKERSHCARVTWSPAANGPAHVELIKSAPEDAFPSPNLPPRLKPRSGSK